MSVRIRPIAPQDFTSFLALYREVFPGKRLPADLIQRIVEEPARVFVAEAEGENTRLVAFLYYWDAAGKLEIIDIGVAPQSRRRGLAKELIGILVNEAEATGKEIFLETRASNAAAIALYERRGFRRTGLRKHYYPDGEDAILYTYTPGARNRPRAIHLA